MRRAIVAVGLCGVVAGAGNAAWADNVHFKRDSPVFTDQGLTLTEGVKLAGLGNGDLVVRLTATGVPTAVCINPAGANQPPGQNPAEVSVDSGQVSIPSNQIKNGNVTFDVTTVAAPLTIDGAPDCPNRRWTEAITGMAFTSARLAVTQSTQEIALPGSSCSFLPATTDGAVPGRTVFCG